MKAVLFKHSEAIKSSFFILRERSAFFYDTLHYHPEYQLTVINEGQGTFFIADHIERYAPGDVFLIGPNLPHVFRSDNEYYEKGTSLKSDYTGAYFTTTSFGNGFFELEENSSIKTMLEQVRRGAKITGVSAARLAAPMNELGKLKGTRKITGFLEILDTIASASRADIHYLSSPGFLGSVKKDDNDRMSRVFDYVMENFTKNINLEDVAGIACMTTTAFCRFFKKRTQKSLVEFITEARVGYACKLIQEERLTVSEIAFESGFHNISNFNRQFKRITGKTPSSYLSAFRHKGAAA